MTARQVRSLDQRIADTRRELEALEARKRVREDKTLKWLASTSGRLRKIAGRLPGDQDIPGNAKNGLLNAAAFLDNVLLRALREEEAAP